MQPQLLKTSVIFTANLSMTEFYCPKHWSTEAVNNRGDRKGILKGMRDQIQSKNEQEQNLQPRKSREVQFSVNPYLCEMFTDIHLWKMVLMKIPSLQ